MKRMYLLVALMAGFSAPSLASERAACEAMAQPTLLVSKSFAALLEAALTIEFAPEVASQFTGEDLEALTAFAEAKDELVPVMSKFLERSQHLSGRMVRCSK